MTLKFSETVSMCVYILVFILDRSKWISTILTTDSLPQRQLAAESNRRQKVRPTWHLSGLTVSFEYEYLFTFAYLTPWIVIK